MELKFTNTELVIEIIEYILRWDHDLRVKYEWFIKAIVSYANKIINDNI